MSSPHRIPPRPLKNSPIHSSSASPLRKPGRAALFALAAALGLGIAQPLPAPAATAPRQVTLILNWLPGGAHVPVFYAREAGFYKRAGIDVTIESAKGSANAIAALGQGKAQFAIAEAAELFTEQSGGLRATGVMVYFSRSPNAVITLERPDIRKLSDLAGKRIAAPRSSFPRILFPVLSAKGKIDLTRVRWQNLSPKELLPALIRGTVDAVASSAMVAHQYRAEAAKKGRRITVLPLADAGVNPYSLVLAAPQEFIEKNPALARAFVRATARGTAAALERPRDALKAFLKANPAALPARTRAEWRTAHGLIYSPGDRGAEFGKFTRPRIEEMRRNLARLRRLRTISSTIGVYSNALMPALRPRPGRL